ENEKEIWLEKTENKKTNIIRLHQGGFHWQNHLKRDIAQVFQITKNMKKVFKGKKIKIHNVYVSAYKPVDDWEQLKKPLHLEDKNTPIKMQMYYITKDSKEQVISQLQQSLHLTP